MMGNCPACGSKSIILGTSNGWVWRRCTKWQCAYEWDEPAPREHKPVPVQQVLLKVSEMPHTNNIPNAICLA